MNRFNIAEGQARAWSILARSHAAGKVASTYLFAEPEGAGAWCLGVEFAALLNCEAPQATKDQSSLMIPCGSCPNCHTIFGLNSEALHLIVPIRSHKNHNEAIDLTNEILEAKRQEPFSMIDQSKPISIPIDLARETRKRLNSRPPAGLTRVVMFYQMDRMRASSADALLKLIEEPPAGTIIILTASQPQALLPTILSRSQKIRLVRLPEPMVVKHLQEHYQATESSASLAARVCDRSLGRAIKMVSDSAAQETDQRSVGLMLFKVFMTGSTPELVTKLSDLINFNDRGGAEQLVRLWQSLIRDTAWYANTGDVSDLINIDFQSEFAAIAPRLANPAVVEGMVTTTKNTLADLARNVHIQPALVAMALKLKMDLEAGG